MQLINSDSRYGQIARVLHWTSVALILTSVVLGSGLHALGPDETDDALLERHILFGSLLLAVMLLRFAWRLRNANPLLSYTIAAWQKRAAISVHWFLYTVVITQCLVGVIQVLADGAIVSVGQTALFATGSFAETATQERLNDVHARLTDVIYIAVAIHVAAALVHQVFGVVDEQNAT